MDLITHFLSNINDHGSFYDSFCTTFDMAADHIHLFDPGNTRLLCLGRTGIPATDEQRHLHEGCCVLRCPRALPMQTSAWSEGACWATAAQRPGVHWCACVYMGVHGYTWVHMGAHWCALGHKWHVEGFTAEPMYTIQHPPSNRYVVSLKQYALRYSAPDPLRHTSNYTMQGQLQQLRCRG